MIPQSRRPAFLLTRPEALGQSFAASLRAELGPDLRIVTSPLLAPRHLRPALPKGDFAAVLFTSQAGVAAAANVPSLPRRAFCVGDRTAEVARAAGFDALSAGGAAADLIDKVKSARPEGRLLYLRGRDTRGDVAASLTAAGYPTVDLVIYEQVEQSLTPEARDLLAGTGPVIAPLFSPRTARLFVHAYRTAGGTAPLFLPVLSGAIADTLPEGLHARIFVAAQPRADALILASLAAFAAGESP